MSDAEKKGAGMCPALVLISSGDEGAAPATSPQQLAS